MAESGAAASYVAKWQRAHPEMLLLMPFCPPAQRGPMEAWGALQHELAGAMFDTSDSRVARTKLAWWGDDLAAGPVGSQHPLARALLAAPAAAAVAPAQWRDLALAAIGLSDAVRHAPGAAAPVLELDGWAASVARIESAVFNARSTPDAVAAGARVDLLLRQGHDAADVVQAASALLANSAVGRALPLYRAGRLAFDGWRLQRLASGVPLPALPAVPAWRGLLLAWHAARRSRAAAAGDA
jgi:hypothetical protein